MRLFDTFCHGILLFASQPSPLLPWLYKPLQCRHPRCWDPHHANCLCLAHSRSKHFNCQLSSLLPCEPPSETPHPVYWLPEPQREFFNAYLRFLGASPRLSGLIQSVSPRAPEFCTAIANPIDLFLRYLPFYSLVSSIKIPALKNAKLLPPSTSSKRWPILIFSHGLGGSRNAYSHLLASLASHGVVAIAADHRDGSAPLSIIRNIEGTRAKVVEYIPLPLVHSPVVEDGRDKQMRIRLWELGTIYEALLKIDRGEHLTNIAAQQPAEANLSMFTSLLDVHTPGSISWSGHSFGAATMVHLFKSVFYRAATDSASSYKLCDLLEFSSIYTANHAWIPSQPSRPLVSPSP